MKHKLTVFRDLLACHLHCLSCHPSSRHRKRPCKQHGVRCSQAITTSMHIHLPLQNPKSCRKALRQSGRWLLSAGRVRACLQARRSGSTRKGRLGKGGPSSCPQMPRWLSGGAAWPGPGQGQVPASSCPGAAVAGQRAADWLLQLPHWSWLPLEPALHGDGGPSALPTALHLSYITTHGTLTPGCSW